MAKFKVRDEVLYKGRHYIVHRVNGDRIEISDWMGHDLTVDGNDPDLKFISHNSRACNAKFKVGDRVAYYGKESAIYRLRGKVSDVSQIRGETFVTVDLDNGEEWGAPEKDWGLLNSRARNSTNPVVQKALNACARNGAYDTLEIRKDPKYGNSWCIYQEGVSVRAVPRVFDTPESAKKYIREQMPAWSGAKVRVKNACGTARNAKNDDPFTMKAYDHTKRALALLEGARLMIGGAENDEDVREEASAIDQAIGQVKKAIKSME